MTDPTIAVIGGTGLYQLDGLEDKEKLQVTLRMEIPAATILRASWKIVR